MDPTKEGSGPGRGEREREREHDPLSLPRFPPCLSHPLFSLPFSLLFFLVVSLFFSLYLSFYPLLSFCFSLFAARRCVWSVVAAARVDSLITLPTLPVPCPPLLLLVRALSRSRYRRGKRVKRYRRSRAPVCKSSSMNASTSPSALNLYPLCPPPVRTSLVIRDHLRQPPAG